MKAGKFKKQSSESFIINANFAANMDIAGGEDLVENNCSVVAIDGDGDDASSTVLVSDSLAIGTGDNKGKLYIQVQAGTEDKSPYKITFKSGETSTGEEWEKDVYMTIKEI